MKKDGNSKSLSNLFKEFEETDLTGKELDNQLIEFGFDPKDLARKVRERIERIKAEGFEQPKEEFDPLLLAAGKRKKKKTNKRSSKND